MYQKEQERKLSEQKDKQITQATEAVIKRLQKWLETHLPHSNHDAILADPKVDSVPQQHPHLEAYLEILLTYQEANLGVVDELLEPDPSSPEEQTKAPPPLPQPEIEGTPAPATPPP